MNVLYVYVALQENRISRIDDYYCECHINCGCFKIFCMSVIPSFCPGVFVVCQSSVKINGYFLCRKEEVLWLFNIYKRLRWWPFIGWWQVFVSPVREESVVDAAPLLLHLADPARVFELSFQLSHPRLFFSKPFSSKGDLVKNGFGTYVAI